MYDVIVVGARCAGSPLAMLLARQGARVLLVDRATFPSDIPHGHFVHRHGPPRLRKSEEAIRLAKARVGMIDRESFFNPENIQRLLGGLPAV
jgi:flavin-dependent dehydrogenase